MFVESSPSHLRPSPAQLGILLATVEADRRIAGVSAAGRAVQAFTASGLAEIWIVAPSGGSLAAATRDDVARLAGRVPIVWLDESEALARLANGGRPGLLVSTAAHVLTADAVSAFASGGAMLATSGGQPVLWRDGLSPPDAETTSTTITALPVDSRAHWTLVRASGKPEDGIVSRWLNRRISQPISGLLLLVLPWIRPIHATIATALIAALMFVVLLTGTAGGLVVGGLLYQAASILDGVDGEIARLTTRSSPAGATLDAAIDAATNALFLLGMTFNLHWQGYPFALYLGLWSLFAMSLGLWLIGRRAVDQGEPLGFDLIKRRMARQEMSPFARAVVWFFRTLTGRDCFAFLFAFLICIGVPMVSLYIFASVAVIWISTVFLVLIAGRRSKLATVQSAPRVPS